MDAPLDDANIDRFTALLRHFARNTQFVVITHNKKTMEICDALYGVTMQEPGCSKLVSVKFEHAAAGNGNGNGNGNGGAKGHGSGAAQATRARTSGVGAAAGGHEGGADPEGRNGGGADPEEEAVSEAGEPAAP